MVDGGFFEDATVLVKFLLADTSIMSSLSISSVVGRKHVKGAHTIGVLAHGGTHVQ